MIKAVIFDIDGVLIDSFESNIKFYQDLMVSAGYKKPSKSKFAGGIWRTSLDEIKFLTKSKNSQEIKRIWDISCKVKERPGLIRLPKGLLSTIKKLHSQYKLAVVTSRTKYWTGVAMKFTNTKKYFSVFVSYEDFKNPKPHPEPLFKALKRLKVNSGEAVYVGDSKSDAQAAKAAKMRFVGYHQFSKKPLRGADANTAKFNEIPKIIKSL